MELLEYQAKELFKTVGIPILPSLTIQDSRQIKQLSIPYPVVLKSQVRSGGRGKAGGIRFVANTIDAIAAARSIFNLSILGEYPEVILAEAHYNTERELFIAIVLDYDLQCPVLLGSAWGGMNIDALLANLQQVVVEQDFSLFYARRLAAQMGLSGKLICSVSEIIAKMYRLFEERDLDLIEINPLGINGRGELMALDGRITINDHALARQPIMETFSFSAKQLASTHHRSWTNQDFKQVYWRWLDWYEQTGKVAMICSSFDSALLTWDLLKQNQIVPACSAIIENSLKVDEDNLQLYREQILNILSEIADYEGIEVIMLNIWDSKAVSREVLQTICDYCGDANSAVPASEQILVQTTAIEDKSVGAMGGQAIAIGQNKKADTSSVDSLGDSARPYFVLRLLNKFNLEDMPNSQRIHLFSSLEASIERTVALVKSS